jgi:hypothetical protein
VTIDEALRELLEAAAEAGARRALEQSAGSPRRLVPLGDAGVVCEPPPVTGPRQRSTRIRWAPYKYK